MYELFGLKFMKQANMRAVLLALTPIFIAGIYFYGWRVLAMLAVSAIAGYVTEYLFKRKSKKPLTEATMVSASLFTLVLPSSTPLWICAVGMIFGIVFGREVFGGFGMNVFNPALVARAFVYVSFPVQLTASWAKNMTGFPGGFARWSTETIDVISQATPMLHYKFDQTVAPLKDLLLGTVAGSIGESSKVLILLGLAYLLYRKFVFRENILGMLIGFVGISLLFNALGVESQPPILQGLLTGGFLFGMTFMITDPISSARTKEGKYLFGFIAGAMTVVIRAFAIFPGGVMFAILIANMFGPIIDVAVNSYKKSRKEKASGKTKEA